MGDGEIPWSPWRTVVPLVLGFLGWVAFQLQQSFFARHRYVPTLLFTNSISAATFMLTFTSSIILQAVAYFFPVYFQADHQSDCGGF